jgi:hypothetical protein
MKINAAEIYHDLRQEITTHWKTGLVMTGVTIVVGQVYGRVAAAGIVLVAISQYDILGKKITVISWMSLRRVLIAVIVLGNNYYFSVISPQIVSNLALALILFDNFQLSTINVDLSGQNEVLEKNIKDLGEVKQKLENLKGALISYRLTVDEAKAAKIANETKAQELSKIVPSDLVAGLEEAYALLEALLSQPELSKLILNKKKLRESIDSMLATFSSVSQELELLAPKLDTIGRDIEGTTRNLQTTVNVSTEHVTALVKLVKTFETYKRGSL